MRTVGCSMWFFFFFFSNWILLAREEVETRKILSGDGSCPTIVLHGLGGVGKTRRTRSAQRKSPQAMMARNWRATRYTDPAAVDIRKFLLESYQSSVIIIPRSS